MILSPTNSNISQALRRLQHLSQDFKIKLFRSMKTEAVLPEPTGPLRKNHWSSDSFSLLHVNQVSPDLTTLSVERCSHACQQYEPEVVHLRGLSSLDITKTIEFCRLSGRFAFLPLHLDFARLSFSSFQCPLLYSLRGAVAPVSASGFAAS